MIKRVEINGRRWYERDKQLFPSFSSVLEILFPGSKDFVPEDALAMGVLCHAEIAKALLCRVNKVEYQPHEDPKVAKRIAAALKFVDDHVTEILAVESENVFMNVGLTPDFVGVGKNMHSYLIDWKFAEAVAAQYYYQADFYQRAEKTDRAAIVQINREAEISVHKVSFDARRWTKIVSAINVRHHLDEKEKRYVE